MSSAPRPASSIAVSDADSPVRDDAAIIKAGLAAVEEYEAEYGPISAEALAWAEEVFDEAFRSSEEPPGK